MEKMDWPDAIAMGWIRESIACCQNAGLGTAKNGYRSEGKRLKSNGNSIRVERLVKGGTTGHYKGGLILVGIRFGKLSDLLQQFKADFLAHLTPEDLNREATLWIGEPQRGSPGSDQHLIDKLVEVIENE